MKPTNADLELSPVLRRVEVAERVRNEAIAVTALLLGRYLVEQILASGEARMWLAIRGLVLFATGVGLLANSAYSR